jgi:dTDP-4-dehydrorhamnose reductase
VGAPTSAALIADVTRTVIERIAGSEVSSELKGTYHLTAQGSTSWHGYAAHIVREASTANVKLALPLDALKPISTAEYPTPAKRPANSRLDCKKLMDRFDIALPQWQEGVDDVLARLRAAGK